MNIVFLGVDGVLNSRNAHIKDYQAKHKSHSKGNYPFEKQCLKNFQFLIKETDSRIVLTTKWRLEEDSLIKLFETLQKYGLDEYIIDSTPVLGNREEEIKTYLSICKYNPSFVILDESHMEELSAYAIQTNPEVGLTKEDVKEAIRILLSQIRQKEITRCR